MDATPPEHGDAFRAALAELARAASGVQPRRFERGELLFRQDELGDALFYILQGSVRIYLLSAGGQERSLLILGPGETVGDISFQLQERHTTYAEAFGGPVELFEIGVQGYEMLLQACAPAGREFLKALARKARWLTQQIAEQSFLDVRARVQVALIRLAGQHGRPGPGGIVIDMPITHESLAALVGANRTTVSSCLSILHHEGFYSVVNQRIVLSPWGAGLVIPP